jgi:hemerythrin-like metal-binding protein
VTGQADKEPNIELGVPQVDAEHREQLMRMNRLVAAMAEAKAPSAVAEDLESLIGFLEAHFLSEQIVMREQAYPGYDAHQLEHDEAIALMRRLQDRFLAGDLAASEELMRALRGWLVGHIQSADRVLAGYLTSHGVAKP